MRIMQTKLIKVLLILVMCLIALAPAAFAAPIQSGEIPVAVSLGGSPPTTDESYKIIMKADNPAYPLPEGSVDGTYIMFITGGNATELPAIGFSSLGVYTYTILQEAGINKLGIYDSRVYNLVIYVTNIENGSGFETTVILYKRGETEKLDEVVFYNDYDKDPTPIPESDPDKPKTNDITAIWPNVGLFAGGVGILLILGFTAKRKGKMKN